jgi:hypothetical protein
MSNLPNNTQSCRTDVRCSFLSIMGYFFMNTKWFRNSKIGWKWACKYHPEVDGTDEYLLWQDFKIK